MKPITNLLIAGLLLFVHTLVGQNLQTSFSPATITANVGEQVAIEFRVTNFTNINSVQLPITYNASVLRFDSLDAAYFGPDDQVLPGYGDSTTASHPNAGKVVFTWYPNLLDYPDGYTLPANTRLFTLRFTVIGNGTANINVSTMSPGIEVIRSGAPISTTNNNGTTVTGGNGQPTYVGFKIIANQIHIPKGHVGCMPITVNDFDSMWSMQFAMHWDPLKLKYECTRAYNLPDLTSASFGAQGALTTGTLLAGWADPNQLLVGTSRADGAKIFDVCFTAIGNQGANALVTIDGVGFPPSGGGAEAINSSVQDVWEATSGITDTAYIITIPPPANAVKYDAGRDTAMNGAIACVPVKVTNHTNVTNAEYIITTDGTKLAFQSIGLGANPMGLVIGTNFNTAAVGRVRFTYNNATGITLPNNTTIFNVCYTVGDATVAPLNTEIPVNITSAACTGGGPFPVGVSKKNFGGFPIAIDSGAVRVGVIGPATATFAVTNVTCFGLTNGAVNTTVNNGAGCGYNWTGPGGFTATTQNLTNVGPGTYVVTVTLCAGGTIVSSTTVTQPTALQIPTNQLNITPVKCTGETNGAIFLMPSGGTIPYTYAWSGPNNFTSTSNNLMNLDNGTYVVTVTDNKGCILISQQLNVLEAATLLTPAFNTSTNVKCLGEANGSAQITVTGGQTPYAFSWRDFNNLQVSIVEDPTNLTAGIYNIIVTDAYGCTKSLPAAVTITAPQSALTVNSLITNVVCNGASTGAISLTISGGWPGNNTIVWTPTLPAIPNPTVIPANTYTASVTDAGGCVVTHVAQVTEPAGIQFDTVITPQSGVTLDGAIDLTILSGGVAPLAYAWTGPNGYSAITQDISGLAAGPYTVTITDAASCQRVIPFTVPSANVASVLSVVDACGNNGCINLLLTGTAVPPYIITLTSSVLPGGTKEVLTSDATPELCDLPAGFYSIIIADGNSNVYDIGAVQVEQLEQALVSELTTPPTGSNNNGSITLTHSFQSNFNFIWNTGSVDSVLTNLAAGTYTVTVTNTSSLCTAVYSYTLTPNNPLVVTSTQQNPNCLLAATGSINLVVNGGTPPYLFSWTGPNGFTASTQNLTGLLAGTYSVTVSDQGGTLFSNNFPLPATSLLAISTVNETSNYGFGFQVSSADVCDGAASVVVSNALGNVSILWSSGETGFSASALCGGAYTVTVSDQSGCSSVWSDNLLAPSSVSGTSTQLSNYNGYGVSCFESCDGSVRFFPAGGVPPYKVTWPTGQIDQGIPAGGASVAEELCGGTISVTITDFLGATKVVTVTLLQPDPLEVEFSAIPPTTFNSCDGEVLAVVPGAVGQFTATWSGSFGSAGTGPRAEDLCAGEVVQFIIEDANGCTAIGVDTLFSKDIDCMSLRPVITPGLQDGKNDYLLITCAESTRNHIEIYNRWGQLVFETDNYDNSSRVWTGLTDSGKPLAEGVYYYVLTYDGAGGEQVVAKGHINLLR